MNNPICEATQRLRDQILEFVRGSKEPLSTEDVAHLVKEDIRTVRGQLRYLRLSGQIQRTLGKRKGLRLGRRCLTQVATWSIK